MKKFDYVRPLAEVTEIMTNDIITASALSTTVNGGGSSHGITAGTVAEYGGSGNRLTVN